MVKIANGIIVFDRKFTSYDNPPVIFISNISHFSYFSGRVEEQEEPYISFSLKSKDSSVKIQYSNLEDVVSVYLKLIELLSEDNSF